MYVGHNPAVQTLHPKATEKKKGINQEDIKSHISKKKGPLWLPAHL
jgi:hypothetical protein